MVMNSSYLLTFLLNSLWQIPLIAAVAALACYIMRNGPASHRHAVWVAALLAAIVLPLQSVGRNNGTTATDVELAPQVQALRSHASGSAPGPVSAIAPRTSDIAVRQSLTTIFTGLYGLIFLVALLRF